MDHDACLALLETMFHPRGLSCPACGCSARKRFGRTVSHGVPRYRCRACGRIYTVISGTIFSGTKLDPRRIVLLLYLAGIGADHALIARMLDIPVERVRSHLARVSLYGAMEAAA
jgi:transposase-like protein